ETTGFSEIEESQPVDLMSSLENLIDVNYDEKLQECYQIFKAVSNIFFDNNGDNSNDDDDASEKDNEREREFEDEYLIDNSEENYQVNFDALEIELNENDFKNTEKEFNNISWIIVWILKYQKRF
ncbi:15021_t:CDS:2, partial [Funneliformis mosseae]